MWLLIAWLVVGALTTIAGFGGWISPWLSGLLVLPLIAFIFEVRPFGLVTAKKLLIVFVSIWLIHATGLLVPETGFDAVWYHLPVIEAFVQAGQIVYIPEYYQSLNPLWSDLLFLLGFQIAGEMGAKVVAFFVALSLVLFSFRLASLFLDKRWTWWFVIQVSLIQVVAWQATSFYVDVAKAMWEVGSIWILLEAVQAGKGRQFWLIVLSGLAFGASLATKQFSWLLLGPMVLSCWIVMPRKRFVGWWLASALVPALPFFIFSWWVSGHAFYSVILHLQKLSEIGGQSQISKYVGQRLWLVPTTIWQLVVVARDYVSPLLALLAPLAVMTLPAQMKRDRRLWVLVSFVLAQLVLWWWVPPLSTRYAVSGFIVLLLLLFVGLEEWVHQHPEWYKPVIIGLALVTAFLVLPRLYVAKRNLTYALGGQSKAEYLQQFYDGNIDQHLRQWHSIE